ncbi:MAG: ATP-binding cassette domain-containing protein [Clostridia bacterium]|nr:ATP-binding cassette domain-containing protein [Clostridia bacterium]
MALLEVKDVDFRYYGSSFELKGVNLSLNNVDKLVIYGRENAGKTTLLRVLCGLENYVRGSILLEGIELKELSHKDMDVGFSFDRRILDGKAIAGEIISMPMKLREVPPKDIDNYLEEMAKKCNLPMQAQVKDLSDMQVAMLILARLFSVDRRLYLVDDVWKDLPEEEKSIVEDFLIEIVKDKSVIVASDDEKLAKRVTTGKILVLTDREVAPMLSLDEISSRPINMQSAILAGYELHIGELIKESDNYFAIIGAEQYLVAKPICDIYVGKRVCFAIKRLGELSDKDEVGDGEVMSFYYDVDVERIITA